MKRSSNTNRMDRINEEIKRELSHIITFDIKDPGLTGLISITKVIILPIKTIFSVFACLELKSFNYICNNSVTKAYGHTFSV